MENFYFAQFTDIHIGSTIIPETVKLNLQWALNEVNNFDPKPEIILCTGDCVCNGLRCELEEFKSLMTSSTIPYAALPANHDLWGENDDSVWQELIGPMRKSTVVGSFKFLLWNDIKRCKNGWSNAFTAEDQAWLESELEDAATHGLHVVCGVHNPPDFRNNYSTACSRWTNEDTEKLFDLLAKYDVKALISGDYHVSDRWKSRGVVSINTASLNGFIWNGIENFPVKPGYRLFHWNGETLRTFWRNGSYWVQPPQQTPETKKCISFPTPAYNEYNGELWQVMSYEMAQISLSSIGGVWTGGPRPLVRPMYVFDRTKLQAQTFSSHLEIESVSWSLNENDWRPMQKVWSGIWEEWEADFDPDEFRNGEYLCRVRAEIKGGSPARYLDSVPVILCGPRNSPRGTLPVIAGELQVRQSFRTPYD